mmetsp:Transcript_25860/g.33083  ORF Transcript_25860/g.33083 Transcript_25860/m.33083 type:complete len:92 (-) Transcript_25860:342-617(-)
MFSCCSKNLAIGVDVEDDCFIVRYYSLYSYKYEHTFYIIYISKLLVCDLYTPKHSDKLISYQSRAYHCAFQKSSSSSSFKNSCQKLSTGTF